MTTRTADLATVPTGLRRQIEHKLFGREGGVPSRRGEVIPFRVKSRVVVTFVAIGPRGVTQRQLWMGTFVPNRIREERVEDVYGGGDWIEERGDSWSDDDAVTRLCEPTVSVPAQQGGLAGGPGEDEIMEEDLPPVVRSVVKFVLVG